MLRFWLYSLNLTEEKDNLKQYNNDIHTNIKNLKEERDELKRKLNDLDSKKIVLTQERDHLKRSKSEIEAQSRTISRERDDLRTRLNTLNSQHQLVARERDGMRSMLKNLGWEIFGRSAYYVSVGKKNQEESRSYCKSKGADLIVINSLDELLFANRFNKYMWIGLTARRPKGRGNGWMEHGCIQATGVMENQKAKQMKIVGTSRAIIWRKAGMMKNVQFPSTELVKRDLLYLYGKMTSRMQRPTKKGFYCFKLVN